MENGKYRVDCYREGNRMAAVEDTLQQAIATHRLMKTGQYIKKPIKLPAKISRTNASGEPLSLSVAIDLTDRHRWSRGKNGSTSRRNAEIVMEFFGETFLLSDLRTSDLQRFVDHMRDRGAAAQTIKNKLSAISAVFSECECRGLLVDRNGNEVQAPRIPRVRSEDNARQLSFTSDEVDTIIRVFRENELHDHADAVVCLAYAGFRMQELSKLLVGDITSTSEGAPAVIIRNPKNGDRMDVRPIHGKAHDVLLRRSKGLSKDDRLFLGGMNWMTHKWNTLVRPALFPDVDSWQHKECVPHILRHTFGSWLVSKGVPLATIMKLMGHKSITTTQRYAKVDQGAQVEALGVLG